MSSCCPARRASWRPSGDGRSSSSRSPPCARARARCCGTRCASTAWGSRPWRGPSPPPVATRRHAHDDLRARHGGGGHDPRGARAAGRPRRARRRPARAAGRGDLLPRTSARCPSTCSSCCVARPASGGGRVVHRRPRRGAAGGHPGLLGRPARRRDRVRRRRQARAAGRAGGAAGRVRGRLGRGRERRWRRAPAPRPGPRSASP